MNTNVWHSWNAGWGHSGNGELNGPSSTKNKKDEVIHQQVSDAFLTETRNTPFPCTL